MTGFAPAQPVLCATLLLSLPTAISVPGPSRHLLIQTFLNTQSAVWTLLTTSAMVRARPIRRIAHVSGSGTPVGTIERLKKSIGPTESLGGPRPVVPGVPGPISQ